MDNEDDLLGDEARERAEATRLAEEIAADLG